jgi:hypothetical protein
VICVYQEGDLLSRLLEHAAGDYDDLVVVHDGPDTTQVRQVAETAGGRFFEQPRAFQQEPHWAFAWAQAKFDWILRWDADEMPSAAMKDWLRAFRRQPEPPPEISGYTCSWPLWDGQKAVSTVWPAGRNFLFHRQRVRFFGMVEQVPVADGTFEPLKLTLHHQPKRKSYGLRNLLVRQQAYRWRERIAHSLLGKPTELKCWRWPNEAWPEDWEQIRRRPFSTALSRLTLGTFRGLRAQWRQERKLFPLAAVSGPVHHALICLKYWQLRRRAKAASKQQKMET